MNVKVRHPSINSYQDIYHYSVSNFAIEIWIMIEILKISAFFEVNIWENLTSNLTINRFLHLLRVVSCIRGPVNLKLQKNMWTLEWIMCFNVYCTLNIECSIMKSKLLFHFGNLCLSSPTNNLFSVFSSFIPSSIPFPCLDFW